MKIKKIAMGLLFSSVLWAACSKEHPHEFIEGQWKYDSKTEGFNNGQLIFTHGVEAGDINFESDGTGSKTLTTPTPSTRKIRWWANDAKVLIEEEVNGTTGPFWLTIGDFNVPNNSDDNASLITEGDSQFIDPNGVIIPVKVKVTLNLKR